MVFHIIILANVNSAMAAELESWAAKSNVLFKSKYHWIRCSSHIINLAVNSIILNKNRVIECYGTDY